ncbi:MAG: FtsX-like permease family protein [Acidobacteriota bacterium]|nr:FtsX-like permease family protein [Acidobacteriota bacterium]
MSAPLSLLAILRRSLVHRRARSLSALVALTVSAAVATTLLTLYASLDAKLHHEFRSFGANLVVTAPAGATLPPETRAAVLATARREAGPDVLAAPFAYAVATTDRGTSVVVVGTDFAAVRRLDSWWQVPAWPTAAQDALIGQRAANFIADEANLRLTFNGQAILLHSTGRLQTGGDEDSRVYLALDRFSDWTHTGPSVLELQVPGGAAQVETVLAQLHQQFPALTIQPVRQLVEGEAHIVDRTHALMYAAVLLIALTVGVSVLATLSASVLERRRDFALMRALGGTQPQLLSLFLLEATLLALAGVAAGYLLGSAMAWLISETNFHTPTLPRLSVLPLILLLNFGIAVLASVLPARVLRGLQPAALLRGE